MQPRRISSIVPMIWAVLLSSCASSGPQFSAVSAIPDGKAVIYVYRPWRIVGSAGVDWPIAVDGRRIGDLANGEYVSVLVSPGLHTVDLGIPDPGPLESATSIPVDVSVVAGASAYVRANLTFTAETMQCCAKFDYVLLDARAALAELAETRHAQP